MCKTLAKSAPTTPKKRYSVQKQKNILATDRLILREITIEDLDDISGLVSDPEVMRYFPKPLSREEARHFLKIILKQYSNWGFGWWALILKKNSCFIGYTGLTIQTVDGNEEIEIGYMIKREYWGQGLATEAAQACRDYAFETLDYDRVISIMDEPNVASRRVAEKNGMAFEKMTEWKGQSVCIYSVIKRQKI